MRNFVMMSCAALGLILCARTTAAPTDKQRILNASKNRAKLFLTMSSPKQNLRRACILAAHREAELLSVPGSVDRKRDNCSHPEPGSSRSWDRNQSSIYSPEGERTFWIF